MLEAPTNMLSILAILCYLCAMRQRKAEHGWPNDRLRLLVKGAGFFCALALLVKGTAVIPPLVIGLTILVRRRWSELLWFVVSLLGTCLLCASVFLIGCPVDYIKKTYFFHMLRPWGGTVHPLARLAEMWSYPWSWATMRIALGGVAVTALAGRKMRNRDLWLVVLAWVGLLLLLLLTSRTYWATYFSQLAVPLGILGGSLLNRDLDHNVLVPLDRLPVASSQLWPLLQVGTLAVLLVLGSSQLSRQWTAIKAALEQTKPAYVEICSYIRQHLPPDAPILAFETNYTFLSSHQPAGAREGAFFVDSYGEMLYRNTGIPDRSVSELLAAWPRQERIGARAVFHREPAQREVLAGFTGAPYMVFDGRALRQLAPETSAHILAHTRVLESAHATELRMRVPE